MMNRERRSASMLFLGMLHSKWRWGDFEGVFHSVGQRAMGPNRFAVCQRWASMSGHVRVVVPCGKIDMVSAHSCDVAEDDTSCIMQLVSQTVATSASRVGGRRSRRRWLMGFGRIFEYWGIVQHGIGVTRRWCRRPSRDVGVTHRWRRWVLVEPLKTVPVREGRALPSSLPRSLLG